MIMVIESNVINEIEINKSRFITYLYKVKSKDEVLEHLNNLKKEYKDATHICYAYILDNLIKFDDDNEPQGTAGLPILEVLKKNNLNHVVCFVIRYFGGIKLGSGGLIRAYSNSTSLCLKKTKIVKYQELFKVKLIVTYQENKLIEKLLKTDNILDTIYDNKITYVLVLNKELLNKLDSYNLKYEILDNNYL